MKNTTYKLSLALLLIAVFVSAIAMPIVVAMAPLPQPPTSQPVESTARTPIDLRYWILDAPPEIDGMAQALDFERIGFVRPKLYQRSNPSRFDAARAMRNFDAISEALYGMDWGISDLEGEPRRKVRYPHEYDEFAEVLQAIGQFVTMVAWFRNHFPDLKWSEWNLSPGKDSDQFPLAERLVISQFDAIDISMFWRDTGGWLNYHRQMLEHAVELGREHDKPVIVWVWERYKVWNEDHTVAVYTPVPREAIERMLDLSVVAGVDIVVFWSNTYYLLAEGNPKRVIWETVGRDADYDPLPVINAWIVSFMAEMRLRAETLSG